MSKLRRLSRRSFLATGTLIAADAVLTGCIHSQKVMRNGALNTPGINPNSTPLTIDVHCHIFNGTDLQVSRFLGHVAVPSAVGEAFGDLLEAINWKTAPTGEKELKRLSSLLAICSTPSGKTRMKPLSENELRDHDKDSYQLARAAVLATQMKLQSPLLASPPSGGYKALSVPTNAQASADFSVVAEPNSALHQQQKLAAQKALINSFAEPNYDIFLKNLDTRRTLTSNTLQTESLTPAKAANAKVSFNLIGMVDFIVQYFRYRYVSAQDYLNTFAKPARRNVDLMFASMVDYDWWLAGGAATPTSLDTQVELMSVITTLSGGRIHGFIPFCPLREVAFRAGKIPACNAPSFSSLELVKKAITTSGFVGVKLYPPMGFAAYGNERFDKQTPPFWNTNLLPAWTSELISYPDEHDAKWLGARLDDALDCLYHWCCQNGVPILAHSDATNGPSKEFQNLAAAKYWKLALARHPKLRVNFGHLGGIDAEVTKSSMLPVPSQAFLNLMGGPGQSGEHAYGDAAFDSSILDEKRNYSEMLESAYKKQPLASRFLYGTDWSLLLQTGHNKEYFPDFLDLFKDIDAPACTGHSAADCFFGWNAVDYAGLRQGQPARNRLDSFYTTHCIQKPAWAHKVDA